MEDRRSGSTARTHRRVAGLAITVAALTISTAAVEPEPQLPNGMVSIPAGRFPMGKDGGFDSSPVHEVRVSTFLLDRHEVTNAAYLAFCTATEHRLPAFWGMNEFTSGPDFPNHPVVGVSWDDAQAYAAWAEKRLPTEAEWEYAARGGLDSGTFPSGDSIDTSLANYAASGTVPVGSYPANGFGVFDMAGNVAEWVQDFYDPAYYRTSPADNPRGPERGKLCVVRGGGWHGGRMCVAVHDRNALKSSWVDFAVGFRCAKDPARAPEPGPLPR